MKPIVIEKLNFGYGTDPTITDLDLCVSKGELVTIFGENGSGKSTLLKLMLGELRPRSGSVKILGEEAHALDNYRMLGYVPQVQNSNTISFPVTVLELVVLNLYDRFGPIKIPRKVHKDRARDMLRELDMEEYTDTPINELSGGYRQRAMIARAMINRPKILVLDEPTAGVDKKSKIHFLKLLEKMNGDSGITMILVSHEQELIMEKLKIDKMYKMEEGRIQHAYI